MLHLINMIKTKNIVNNKSRDHLFDNVRAVAIFLVVFGHMIYTYYKTNLPNSYGWYLVLYLINVPLLVFISGYFASFNIKKILTKLVLPLVVFWVLYDYFVSFIKGDPVGIISTVQPYMSLWYLYSLIFWRCCVVGLEHIKHKWLKIATIIAFVVVGLMVGFDDNITREYSLSRSFTFFPFFLMGYFLKTSKFDFKKFKKENKLAILMVIISAVAFMLLLHEFKFFIVKLLYSRSPYSEFIYDPWKGAYYRLLWYFVTTVCVFAIILILPSKKILPLSLISKHSMAIYLVHNFVVEIIYNYKYLPESDSSLKHTFLISILIIVVVTLFMQIKDFAFNNNKKSLSSRYIKLKAEKNKYCTWLTRLFDKIFKTNKNKST